VNDFAEDPGFSSDGDVIRFKRGETWSNDECLGHDIGWGQGSDWIEWGTVDGLTFEDYGTGPKPRFDGNTQRPIFIHCDGTPSPFDDQAIEIIKRRVDENCVVQKALHFKAKDPIRINSGPFKDLIGIFDRWVSEEGRVRVLLDLLSYSAKVELHYSQVEKLT